MRIVWTVHNLHPHNSNGGWLERCLYELLAATVHVQIHLSSATAQVMRAEQHPAAGRPHIVIPHGRYRPVPDLPLRPHEIGPPPASGGPAFGFLGGISAYKGLPELLAAFKAGDPTWRLLIAGKAATSSDAELVARAAAGDPRIATLARWLSDAEYSAWMKACDLLVLPYRRVLNSGSVFMAVSAGVPVLVPNEAVFLELREEIGDDWITTYEGELTAGDMERGLRAAVRARSAAPNLRGRDWADIAGRTHSVYQHGRLAQGVVAAGKAKGWKRRP